MRHKLIVYLGEVPADGTHRIQKIGGRTRYTVMDKITIHSHREKDYRAVKAEDGCVFLVDGKNINAVPVTKEVIWLVYTPRLMAYLEEYEREENTQ